MKLFKRVVLALSVSLLALVCYVAVNAPVVIDKKYTVELVGNGLCSGSYVKAPDGAVYIISAGHCADLADQNNEILALHEDGTETKHKIVKVDPTRDLMILESDMAQGISLGSGLVHDQRIYAYTHPGGGELTLSLGKLGWYHPISTSSFEAFLEGCASLPGTAPGSSGGPILNWDGELVGIVSAGAADNSVTCFVKVQDIREFLKLI